MGFSGVVHVELSAKDPKAAGKFYEDLFGWKIEFDEQMDYVQFGNEQGSIGGGFVKVDENTPAGTVVPYAASDDIEASLAKAESLGATTIVPKTEIPGIGWFGIFVDPSGNRIGIYTANSME